jgi:hypothetical protein
MSSSSRRRTPRRVATSLPLAVLLSAANVAVAQTTGTIVGRVIGPDGAPIANARVHTEQGVAQTTSDSRGRYQLPNVPFGCQHIVVRLLGFVPDTIHVDVVDSSAVELRVLLHTLPGTALDTTRNVVEPSGQRIPWIRRLRASGVGKVDVDRTERRIARGDGQHFAIGRGDPTTAAEIRPTIGARAVR